MAVTYHTQDCSLRFEGRRAVNHWIATTAAAEGRRRGNVAVIFCGDEFLLELNRQHLGHDYHTDIITFDYSEGDVISGDLFIGVGTVLRNAESYGVPLGEELHRVIIHGVLHLCGYKDKTPAEARRMHAKEDFYLKKLSLSSEIKKKR
jgi:rRNA maturation RNase YbeY